MLHSERAVLTFRFDIETWPLRASDVRRGQTSGLERTPIVGSRPSRSSDPQPLWGGG